MPKKRGPGRPRKRKNEDKGVLNVQVQLLLLTIFSALLAVLSLLSLVHAAGMVGVWWLLGMRFLFGGMAWVLVPFFGVLAFFFVQRSRDVELIVPARIVWGAIGIVLALTTALYVFGRGTAPLVIDRALGDHGGLIGYIFGEVLLLAGPIFTWCVVVAALVASVLLTTNLSPFALWTSLREGMAEGKKEAAEKAGEEPVPAADTPTAPTVMKDASEEPPQVIDQAQEEASATAADFAPKRSEPTVPWKYPSLELLNDAFDKPRSGDIKANAVTIQKTLANFGIPVEMSDVHVGPTVTQYTLKPAEGVKLSKILSLQNDLALALAAHPIRIEAPIPGQSLVGIEVPNESIAIVRLREVLASKKFQEADGALSFVLGRDVAGHPIIADLAKMPHLLIAGATGSGKSVMINVLLTSLLYRNSPEELKLILVDPKRVELTLYNHLPHLITPVITETKKTVSALKWVLDEMDRRYTLLAEAGKRDIKSFNAKRKEDKMPYLVVMIDELADLMSVARQDVEGAIIRLAQMARAVGIHLVLATQRPSVDVITGLIKANITSRIAFSVASAIDSRTILDNMGAEKLLGNGDMLFISANLSKPKRVQGALIEEEETKKVTEFLKEQASPDFVPHVVDQAPGSAGSGNASGEDAMYDEAKQVVIEVGRASTSLLQRRLRVGYARAARLIDLLEEQGVVGPADGSRPREVFAQAQAPTAHATNGAPQSPAAPTPADTFASAPIHDPNQEPPEHIL